MHACVGACLQHEWTDWLQALSDRGYEILSTGGTAKSLVDANIAVVPVQDVTQFPEMLGGRVKTLHPAVHGGILARRDNSQDVDEMKNAGLAYIDVVVVNLYPFTSTVTSDPPPEFETGVENIDIGGPAMLRAAAKNHAHVAVVVDPADYGSLLENLDNGGPEFRKLCAWKAFQVRSFLVFPPKELRLVVIPVQHMCFVHLTFARTSWW